jgi:hypothetical protein
VSCFQCFFGNGKLTTCLLFSLVEKEKKKLTTRGCEENNDD